MITKQRPRLKNNKCENCHEKNCEFLEYDDELDKWICDACRDGQKIEAEEQLKELGRRLKYRS